MINVHKEKSSGGFRYDFTINKRRYRGAIKEARNFEQARLAAQKIWDRIFNKRYDPGATETPFDKFYRERFLPHSKLHKKSHYDDIRIGDAFCEFFGSEPIEQITWERIEQFKTERSRNEQRPEENVARQLLIESFRFYRKRSR